MRTDSTRSGIRPVSRRLLLSAAFLAAAIAATAFALGFAPFEGTQEARTAPAPSFEQRAVTGHLVRVEPNLLVVADGEGELWVRIHPTTEVVRGVGLSLVTDYDLSRLQLNDSLWVAAEVHDDGTVFARQITANGFVKHDGVIEARGAGFIDVRPRSSLVDEGFVTESMRVWISPAARVEWLDAGGAGSMGYVTDLLVGRRVIFQGFRADDGTLVATLLWPSRL